MHSVMKTLLTLRPNENDAVLTPIWTKLLGIGLANYSQATISIAKALPEMLSNGLIDDNEALLLESHEAKLLPIVLSDFLSSTFTFLLSTSTRPVVITTAAKAFTQIARNCISSSMVQDALLEEHSSVLLLFTTLVTKSLHDVKFKDAWGGILEIAGALFEV